MSPSKEAKLISLMIFCPKLNGFPVIPIKDVSWSPWEFSSEEGGYSDSGLDAEIKCPCGKYHKIKNLTW